MKYFLEAVIPTAEKWKVQLACHLCAPHPATTRARTIATGCTTTTITTTTTATTTTIRRCPCSCLLLSCVRCRDDPPAPSLRGVARWDFVEGAERPVFEGLKRFCELVDSPYHGA